MRNIILASIFGVLIISGSIFYTLRKPVITLDTQESGTQATTTAEMTAIPLVGTQWVWLHTELPANKILSTPNREQYVLTFDTTGRVQSSTDCNTFIGKYVQDGEILSVGPLASTKKACVRPAASVQSEP